MLKNPALICIKRSCNSNFLAICKGVKHQRRLVFLKIFSGLVFCSLSHVSKWHRFIFSHAVCFLWVICYTCNLSLLSICYNVTCGQLIKIKRTWSNPRSCTTTSSESGHVQLTVLILVFKFYGTLRHFFFILYTF